MPETPASVSVALDAAEPLATDRMTMASTSSRATLTVVIPTRNVAHIIADCLASVAWADEILVIDMSSTDGTQAICSGFDRCRVIDRHDYIFGNVNHGIDQATSDWILRLDSDERITPELAVEIQGILADPAPSADGYLCWERIFILGRELRHGFGRRHHRRILFRPGVARYAVAREHEDLEWTGHWEETEHGYVHLNYRSVAHYLQKMDYYIEKDLDRTELPETTPSAWRGILEAARAFYYYYLKLQGFRDGWVGLLDASMRAIYQWVAYAKLRERWERAHA